MFGPNFLDDIDMDFCGDFFEQFDDLLDFPMEDIEETVDGGDCDGFQGVRPPPPENTPVGCPDVLSGKNCDHSSSKLPTELSVPYEDIAQLEWLSNFVDDSYSTRTITVEKSSSNEPLKDNPCFHTSSPVSVLESSITTSTSSSSSSYPAGRTLPTNPTTFVPGRARSKRPRPATFNRRHVFPLISPTSSLTKPTTHFSAGSQSQSEFEDYEEFYPFKKIHEVGAVEQMKKKKKKKKLVLPSGATEQSAVPQTGTVRKCLHCEITKTPQWRAGPMGPKTLCNACGVRYKSGRLFPEYRPAASPTFVAALHSNSHKKVIEMRSKTTTAAVPELVPNSFPSVDYF